MNISELELNLIHRIMEMQESALMNVSNILDENAADWWTLLTKEEQDGIDRGLQQSKNGEGIPLEEVMKRFLENLKNPKQ